MSPDFLLEAAHALHQAARDEGLRIVGPEWVMTAGYVVLAGMCVLAAKRTRTHPSRLRRYSLRLVALVSVLLLPARSEDPCALGRLLAVASLSLFMFSLALPPCDFDRFKTYFEERKKDDCQ